jgi:hypothetical protein
LAASIFKLKCKDGEKPFFDIITIYDFYKVFKSQEIQIALNFTPKNNIYATIAAHLLNVSVINNIAGLGVVFIQKSLFSSWFLFYIKVVKRKLILFFFSKRR